MRNSSDPSPGISRFIALSFIITGIYLIIGYFNFKEHAYLVRVSGYILTIGTLWVIIGVALWLFGTGKLKNILSFFLLINLLYILIETGTYLAMGFRKEKINLVAYNKPCAKFDSTNGYIWYGDSCRTVRISNGEVVFDQIFRPNNVGYNSTRTFYFKKPNSKIKRFIVFGDSFTAGVFLKKSMPKYLEEVLNQDSVQYEFYNFGIDGGGLFNWHRVFFNEIVPHYEFDGVILAPFVDDLYRDFSIFHTTQEGGFFGRFKTVPQNEGDFMKNYFPKMLKTWEVLPDSEIEERIRKKYSYDGFYQFKTPNIYFLKNILLKFMYMKDSEKLAKPADNSQNISLQDLEKKYGKQRLDKFKEITRYCYNQHLPVVVCSIPAKEGIFTNKGGHITEHQLELEFLCKEFHASYFDGYKVFSELTDEEVNNCWLKDDPHWSNKGSMRFAESLAHYILKGDSIALKH